MQIIKNYHKNDTLRQSMSKLAMKRFGIDFDPMYKNGYWSDQYMNISIEEDECIISNISAYELVIEIDYKQYDAVQLGAVMTDPDYLNQGLARRLMEATLEYYKDKEVIFLFANESVMNFYPKFGFRPVKHIKYKQKDFSNLKSSKGRKLDYQNDHQIIEKYVFKKEKNAQRDYVYHDEKLKMFYILYLYQDCLYLHEDGLVIIEKEDKYLWVHDFYGQGSLENILGGYLEGIDEIKYGFEACVDHLIPYEDIESGLFVLSQKKEVFKPWRYPTTSVT